jgi:hypothetical protein
MPDAAVRARRAFFGVRGRHESVVVGVDLVEEVLAE